MQQSLGTREIPELGHGDASKGEGRWVFTQRDTLQSAKGITRRERTRGRDDQRVHLNPVTLVTPTFRPRRLRLFHSERLPMTTQPQKERTP
jgi:hypothetical protein